MMQGLGRRYLPYYNFEYGRSGTLWEGRLKSCLIQEERYLLEVYKYIELNPVREEMVADPGEYRWLSYQINGLGKVSDLCTPHQEYLSLGEESGERERTACRVADGESLILLCPFIPYERGKQETRLPL